MTQTSPIALPPGWSVRWDGRIGVWYATNQAGGTVRIGPEVHLWAPGERAALLALVRAASHREGLMVAGRALSGVRLEAHRG